jgi:16S rRNA (guanine527-N7)-methyltransferase
MEKILKYFPNINQTQKIRFERLAELYQYWNERINVISRKDIENLYERHVLHSLSIARLVKFVPGTNIIDVGTGGGFPGIPLAIMFPETQFHLVDSIGKKITVVNEIAIELGLRNVTGIHSRSENIKQKFDFVVSRAVTEIPQFVGFTKHLISNKDKNSLPNGFLYLKGGSFISELEKTGLYYELFEISDFFEEEFFHEKRIVFMTL